MEYYVHLYSAFKSIQFLNTEFSALIDATRNKAAAFCNRVLLNAIPICLLHTH